MIVVKTVYKDSSKKTTDVQGYYDWQQSVADQYRRTR